MSDWEEEFQNELQRAKKAREKENEGQARVCARRAAGVVVRQYLSRQGITIPSSSAMDVLKALAVLEVAPAEARRAAELLVLRVDESFRLPVDADLLQLAADLPGLLLKE